MDRPYLGYQEIFQIYDAERVQRAYREKAQQTDWAKWARDNPESAKILAKAERLANEEEVNDAT